MNALKASSALKPSRLKVGRNALKKPGAAKASTALRESPAAQDLRDLAVRLFRFRHDLGAHYTRRVLIRGKIHHLTLDAIKARQQLNPDASNKLMTQIIREIGPQAEHISVSKPSPKSNSVELKPRTKTGIILLQVFDENAVTLQQKPSIIRL